jgi:hypothetical protein
VECPLIAEGEAAHVGSRTLVALIVLEEAAGEIARKTSRDMVVARHADACQMMSHSNQ